MESKNKGSFLKALRILIPGYAGYVEREGRRDADKLLRERLAQKLSEGGYTLNEIMLILTNSHRLSVLNEIERAKKILEKIIDKVKYAIYGASGLFDLVQIKEEELDKLYQFDLSLIESVNQINTEIEKLKTIIDKGDEEIKVVINKLISILNQFDKHFDNRKQCILGGKNAEIN